MCRAGVAVLMRRPGIGGDLPAAEYFSDSLSGKGSFKLIAPRQPQRPVAGDQGGIPFSREVAYVDAGNMIDDVWVSDEACHPC